MCAKKKSNIKGSSKNSSKNMSKKKGFEPITLIALVAAVVFGAIGVIQLNDPNSNILVALFNILVAMVSLFVGLRPFMSNRNR